VSSHTGVIDFLAHPELILCLCRFSSFDKSVIPSCRRNSQYKLHGFIYRHWQYRVGQKTGCIQKFI